MTLWKPGTFRWLTALITGVSAASTVLAAVAPAVFASSKPPSGSAQTKLQRVEAAVDKEPRATFKITYAYRNNQAKGSYSLEQQPPDQLLQTSPPSPAELINNGKQIYDCALYGKPVTCIVYPSESASRARGLMGALFDVGTYVSTMKGWGAMIGTRIAGFRVSFSTATFAGQPSDCVSWDFGNQNAKYCVTDNGILAYVGGSGGGSSNAFWLTSYSSHVSRSDFSLPKGAKITKLP